MFCQMSGSCELQSLAYQHGLDHWRYDRAFPVLSVDASRPYFSMDHNRCILCRRCVRACDELVGNATLGLKERGAKTMIIADMDVPFGDSSCVSCGTCLQVCPTGALIDRASAYLGADAEVRRVKTTCISCSIGCASELVVRGNRVIRVEGDWQSDPNHGLLCEKGRFIPLNEKREPLTRPMVKDGSGWRETSWEAALEYAAKGMRDARVTTAVSGFATNESARVIVESFPGAKVLLEGVTSLPSIESLSALDECDLYVVLETDITTTHPVASFALKRGVHKRGAQVFLVGDCGEGMLPWAARSFSMDEASALFPLVSDALSPAVICGAASEERARRLLRSAPAAKLVVLPPAGNSVGLVNAGIENSTDMGQAETVYILGAEYAEVPAHLSAACSKAHLTIVQASYAEPWMEVADVLLPSPSSHYKSGTVTAFDGLERVLNSANPDSVMDETTILKKIAALLG